MISRMIAKSDKKSILRDMVAMQILGSRKSKRMLRKIKRFILVRAAGSVC